MKGRILVFEFSANGTVIFFGNHTEQQGGCVLGTAAEQKIRAFAKPNGTDTVHIEYEDYGAFDMEIGDSEPKAEEAETPAALVRGIMNCFIESGNIFGGFDAKIVSEIPSGSGISEMAAFEILIGKIISGLFFENSVPLFRLAEFGRIAENDYFGNPCGIAERIICALGGTVFADFSNPEMPFCQKIDFDFGKSGYSAAATNAGKTDIPENAYETEKDLAFVSWNMGHAALSEGDEAELIAQFPILRQKCGERAAFRALRYYEETRRAQEAAEALENGDFDEFLRIFEESERKNLVFVPEEKAAEFAEEKEKEGFGVLFVL